MSVEVFVLYNKVASPGHCMGRVLPVCDCVWGEEVACVASQAGNST